MNAGMACQLRRWLAPPHPTWQSRASRNRVREFLRAEELRAPGGVKINVGSASRRFGVRMLNLDLNPAEEVDVLGDLLRLPLRHGSVDTLVCTGVLEHVSDPHRAVAEMYRVLKFGGRVLVETPFMQTVHASPDDYSRWTPRGGRPCIGARLAVPGHHGHAVQLRQRVALPSGLAGFRLARGPSVVV